MTKSEENLKAAFAGESQANRKYLAFAKKADKDGFPQVAKIFRAAAEAETVHAHNHLKELGGIKSTQENIRGAIEGEHHEFTKMYPEFLEDAKSENNKGAERTFNLANEVEKIHHELYKNALEAVESGKDLKKQDVYICPVCGYTVEGEPPDKCPVCGAVKKVFQEIK
ncbi:MAG: rubrerythrin family protein [Promethearchaeota archaeon]|jgi:rubrerythrin